MKCTDQLEMFPQRFWDCHSKGLSVLVEECSAWIALMRTQLVWTAKVNKTL